MQIPLKYSLPCFLLKVSFDYLYNSIKTVAKTVKLTCMELSSFRYFKEELKGRGLKNGKNSKSFSL